MKKYLALFLSVVMLFVAISACTPAEKPNNTITNQNCFTTTSPTTSTAQSFDPNIPYTVSLPGLVAAAKSGKFEYAGNAIEQECRLNLSGNRMASMVFFADGYLQPYSVNGGEYDYIHFLPSGTYTLSFHPVSGTAGESVQFVACTLFQAEFEKFNGEYYNFIDEHFLGMSIAIDLVMKVDAPNESPQVASNLTYIEDIEGIFRATSVLGDGSTEDMGQTDFNVYDKVVQPNENGTYDLGLFTTLTAEKNTEHEVFISGYGKTGRYRVSLFINNELQYAFDGKPYLDMKIVAEKMTTCSFKINTANLNKDNHVYLVYYPLDIDTDELMLHRVRSEGPWIFYVN